MGKRAAFLLKESLTKHREEWPPSEGVLQANQLKGMVCGNLENQRRSEKSEKQGLL